MLCVNDVYAVRKNRVHIGYTVCYDQITLRRVLVMGMTSIFVFLGIPKPY